MSDLQEEEMMEKDEEKKKKKPETKKCPKCKFVNEMLAGTCKKCGQEQKTFCQCCESYIPGNIMLRDHYDSCPALKEHNQYKQKYIKPLLEMYKPKPPPEPTFEKCKLCDCAYLSSYMKEHQCLCIYRPKAQKTTLLTQQIQALDFQLSGVMKDQEVKRLDQESKKALISLNKEAIFYHKKQKQNFITRMQRLGYKGERLSKYIDYIQNKAQIVIHVDVPAFLGIKKDEELVEKTNQKTIDEVFFKKRDNYYLASLNLTGDPEGLKYARKFGTSFCVLRDNVRGRCGFSNANSSGCLIGEIGTLNYCYHILNKFTFSEIKETFSALEGEKSKAQALKSYKEIQVYGSLEFAKDVGSIWIDEREVKAQQLGKMVNESLRNNVACNMFGK